MALPPASDFERIAANYHKAEVEGIIDSIADEIGQAASNGEFRVSVKCDFSRWSPIARLVLDQLREAGYLLEISSGYGNAPVSILIEW